MISVRALECLVAVVDQGSLTKAAAALCMSQPALSHQIAAIEWKLGTPVIEPLSHGIRPTKAGATAAAEARIALAADRAVLGGRQEVRLLEPLRLSAPTSMAKRHSPDILARVAGARPWPVPEGEG